VLWSVLGCCGASVWSVVEGNEVLWGVVVL